MFRCEVVTVRESGSESTKEFGSKKSSATASAVTQSQHEGVREARLNLYDDARLVHTVVYRQGRADTDGKRDDALEEFARSRMAAVEETNDVHKTFAEVVEEAPPVRAISMQKRFPGGGAPAVRRRMGGLRCPGCEQWTIARWTHYFYSDGWRQYHACAGCAHRYLWPHIADTPEGRWYFSDKGREYRLCNAKTLRIMAAQEKCDETTRNHLLNMSQIWEDTVYGPEREG